MKIEIPTFSGVDKFGIRHWGDLYREKMKNGSIKYYIIQNATYVELEDEKEIVGDIYEVSLNTIALCYTTESKEVLEVK